MAALTGRHIKDGAKCKIFAFDKNPQRARLLQQRMNDAGAQEIVEVSNEDFLGVDVKSAKYKSVSCILLDPSCSGSGVARVLERLLERQGDQNSHSDKQMPVDIRLGKLRTFQLAALRKAMSFPSVEYVVYSTCSIHREENESVVAEALSSVLPSTVPAEAVGCDAAPSPWTVVEPCRLIKWSRRGESYPGLKPELQEMLIRCHPSDGLNGFFVAVFKKQRSGCAVDASVPPESELTAHDGGHSAQVPEVPSFNKNIKGPIASNKRKRLSDSINCQVSYASVPPMSKASKMTAATAARAVADGVTIVSIRSSVRPFFKKMKRKKR
jgi:16S rRNA methyltransferase RsmB/F